MLFGHYILIGWRHLCRHKLYSGINILGLAVGLAASLMVSLFVKDELSFDKFWSKADNIFRVHTVFSIPGRDPILSVMSPSPFVHVLKTQFPQVEKLTRISVQEPVVQRGIDSFIEHVALVDEGFIDIFDITPLNGKLKSALSNNSSLALSQTLAKKYFGDKNPIGETLTLTLHEIVRDYTVVCVYKDLPRNSQLNINAFTLIDENQWKSVPDMFQNWFAARSHIFFTLTDNSVVAELESKLKDVVDRNFPKPPIGGDGAKTSNFISLSFMSIKDLHLMAEGFGAMRERGSIQTVITFSAVAVLILVIAAINFMNLSTARSSLRACEVAVRKVVGAKRSQLITQYLGESILMALISMIIALSIVELTLPTYNLLLDKALAIDYLSAEIYSFIGLTVIVGLFAGLYPAFVLSSFRPAKVLKANKSTDVGASVVLRAVLVLVQFSVSIGLFVSTAVVYSQMKYAQNMDLGYTKENLLMLSNVNEMPAKEQQVTIMEELRRFSQVVSVTRSSETADNRHRSNTLVRAIDIESSEPVIIKPINVDYDFFKTYEIPITWGRTYDRDRSDESPSIEELRAGTYKTGKIVINQSAVFRLGFSSEEDAIGKTLMHRVNLPPDKLEMPLIIIGVIPDVHFESLRTTIRPEIYLLKTKPDDFRSISIRFSGDAATIVSYAEKQWQTQIPTLPFSYRFVDQLSASQYSTEKEQAKIFAVFSALAIIVACLGLYGLASFSAECRTKEIGIRKVMGAKVLDIVKLMLWQFSKPVIISNIIAWPVVIYFMSDWLTAFSYRINNSIIVMFCVLSGILVLLIAWVTVSTIAIKIARENPIKALRYE